VILEAIARDNVLYRMVEIEGLAKKHHSSCYIKPNDVLRYVLIDRGEIEGLARKLTLVIILVGKRCNGSASLL